MRSSGLVEASSEEERKGSPQQEEEEQEVEAGAEAERHEHLCGLTQQEFDQMPKILLLGKTQNGKSSLLVNLCNPAKQEELKKKV